MRQLVMLQAWLGGEVQGRGVPARWGLLGGKVTSAQSELQAGTDPSHQKSFTVNR